MDTLANHLYYLLTMNHDTNAPVTFLAGGHVPQCRARVHKHFDGYFVLQYMDSGRVEIFYDEQRHVLEGSWFFPSQPGPYIRFHAFPEGAAWDHRHISVCGQRVEEWEREGLWPTTPQRAPAGSDCAALMDALMPAILTHSSWERRRAANRLENILLLLAEARTGSESPDTWMNQVLQVLQEEEGSFPDYKRVASACHVSPSTLRRRFRASMRMSLHQYVMQRRISRAKAILMASDLPLKTVAEQLGYRDIYYFSRQFKKLAGVTPSAFRESRQR